MATPLESDWKASFIVHCANNFTWPPSRAAEGRFLIGIVGNEEVRTRVDAALSGKKIGNKTVHVITAAATDVPNCHLVYATNSKASGVLSQAKGNAVVTIGESSDGFMTWFTTASDGTLTARGNLQRIQKEGISCNAKIGKVLFK